MLLSDRENSLVEERSTAQTFAVYARVLWRWLWLMILLAVLAGGTAYYFSNKQTPVYQASALAMINVAPSAAESYYSVYLGQQLGASYAKIMTTRPVKDAVAERLGLDDLPGSISVSPISETQLLSVTVTDTDPERAALVANTLVVVFNEQLQADQAVRYADTKQNLTDQMNALDRQIQIATADLAVLDQDIQALNNTLSELQRDVMKQTPEEQEQQARLIQQAQTTLQSKVTQQAQLQTVLQNYRTSYSLLLQSYASIRLAEAQSSSGVVLKEPAVPPRKPTQPQPMRSAMLAAVGGLVVAGGIIILIEFLDDTIRDPQEITRKWGLPVLGMIVHFNSANGSGLITVKQPRSPVSEAFRSVRTNLQFMSVDSPLRTLLVTSPSPTDGKTTIAANLASVIAQSGRRTVLIDSDLRRPRLHKIFALPNRVGLSDQFLNGQGSLLQNAVQQTDIEGLDVITSGSLPPNPSELLGSVKMNEILDQLKQEYHIVILDTPPALVVTDANALASRVDGVLLVVKPSVTTRSTLYHVIMQLEQVNAKLLGVVVNDVKLERSRYYYYHGYYYSRKYGKGYHYGDDVEAAGQ